MNLITRARGVAATIRTWLYVGAIQFAWSATMLLAQAPPRAPGPGQAQGPVGGGELNFQSDSPSYIVDVILMTLLVAGALFAICRGSSRRT